jgi:biotin carboxylase
MKFLFVEAIPAANVVWSRNVGTDALAAARRIGAVSMVATANRFAYGPRIDELTDSWHECDTTSAEAVAAVARAAGADVVFSWIDAFVPVASQAAALLGMSRAANACSPAVTRDKSLVRRQLDAWGVRNARWAVIDLQDETIPDESPIGYPAVIKPVDGTGGKDVMLVTDTASFRAACAAHLSRDGYGHQVVPAYRMVVEELLAGDLVSVEGVVVDGSATIWGYTDRGHTGPPAYVETSFAFAAEPFHPGLEEYARHVAKALDYRTGCFHLEAVITVDGPVMVEFNPRIASGIYQVVDLATGGSCLEAMLRAQLGEQTVLPAPDGAACRIYLEAERDGELRGVRGTGQATAMPGVTDVLVKSEAILRPGAPDRRVGYVQATGATRAQCRARAAAAIEVLVPDML